MFVTTFRRLISAAVLLIGFAPSAGTTFEKLQVLSDWFKTREYGETTRQHNRLGSEKWRKWDFDFKFVGWDKMMKDDFRYEAPN